VTYRCELELEGCPGTDVATFHVRRFFQPGYLKCCSACWRQLVGARRSYTPEVKVNQPKLPSVPRKGAKPPGDLPLYAPPPKPKLDCF
jgi:hypothetical protein